MKSWWTVVLAATVMGQGACFPAPEAREADADSVQTDSVLTDSRAEPPDADAAEDTGPAEDTAPDGDLGDARPHDVAADTVSLGPPAPTGLTASVDRGDDIEVRWQPVASSVGYAVWRCEGDSAACGGDAAWTRLTEAPIEAEVYRDDSAGPPAATPAPGGLLASEDLATTVRVTWEAVVTPAAPRYTYRVVAVGEDRESPPSGTATGHRAERAVQGYEIQVDDGVWAAAPGDERTTAWTHTAPAPPILSAGTVTATDGTYAEFVRLAVSGVSAAPGADHSYVVRAVTAYGPGAASVAARGHTAAGDLAIAWERSAGSEDADYGPLDGAAGATHDDTGAPGDGASRWYRVVVGAPGAADAISAGDPGARQPPPGVPGSVAATADLPDRVKVSWGAVAGASAYHVYRDGERITPSGGVAATGYDDLAAPAVPGGWAAPTTVAATADDSEAVTVSWTAPVRPVGAQAAYRVSAINAAGEGAASASATGRTAAAPLLRYEVEATPSGQSPQWFSTGDTATIWTHANPPLAVISPGSVTATRGDHRAHVALSHDGASAGTPAAVSYRVRGVLGGDDLTPASQPATGRRALGALSLQWQRSTSSATTGFSDLAGATSDTSTDIAAPSDGTSRWYRVRVLAPGAAAATSAAKEGWRLAFKAVGGGLRHTCAVTTHGRLWCWGSNRSGQLGLGTAADEILPPTRVPGLFEVSAFDGGGSQSCAIAGNGDLYCWGTEPLGDGTRNGSNSPLKVLTNIKSFAIGEGFVCAVSASRTVWCWGESGRLGDGTQEYRLSPVSVKSVEGGNLGGATRISSSWAHTCIRATSGDVWCWGLNDEGKAGNDQLLELLTAHQTDVVDGAADIAVAGEGSCARLQSGLVQCWGNDGYGLLGDGSTLSTGPQPVTVVGLDDAVSLSAGWSSFCARDETNALLCWGKNQYGQLGAGTALAEATAPVEVSHLAEVTTLGSGDEHHCAIQENEVWCWGLNWDEQLGVGTAGSVNAPRPVNLP